MAPRTGDPAPDFTAPGFDRGERRDLTLSDLRGRPVVLAFYPGDNTPVCTRQLNVYTSEIDRFEDLDAQVIGISPDSVDSHAGFDQAQGGFAFPLVADEDKEIARAYGVLGPMGFYRRSVFVVDGEGRLAYVHRGFAGATFRKTDELVDAVRRARGA